MQKSHQTLVAEGFPVDAVLMGITVANARDGPELALLKTNTNVGLFLAWYVLNQ